MHKVQRGGFMRPTDHDFPLIQAMAGGDVAALHELYARHGLALLNLLIHELGERPIAEEVLQDVMMAAWQGAAKFRAESAVRTWLIAIAKRQASKTRQRRRDLLDTPLDAETYSLQTDDPAHLLAHAAEQEAVQHAIAQLPLEQQEALEWVFYRGLSGLEAAAQLGIPLNTLKSRLHRARQTLRQVLSMEDDTHAK
jgi:RNA polymerase sigma-70 factor, ECF subfamily